MIKYKKVINDRIEDISYNVNYTFMDSYNKRADVDFARCELKISSHSGYLDVFVSPVPKSTLMLELTPVTGDDFLPITIEVHKDEWEQSNVSRWKNLII